MTHTSTEHTLYNNKIHLKFHQITRKIHAYQIIEIVVILHIFEKKILRFGKKSSFIKFSQKNPSRNMLTKKRNCCK